MTILVAAELSNSSRVKMIQLLFQQQYILFALIAFALIFSLTFHEYGHGKVASLIGDDTAERAGRLTLNPLPHIDPLGLLMVLIIGIGYAKPVPTDPRKFNTRWGTLLVAGAGPGMKISGPLSRFVSLAPLHLSVTYCPTRFHAVSSFECPNPIFQTPG